MTSLKANPLLSYDTADLNDFSYHPIGSPLPNDVVYIRIYNGSNQALWISWDGTDDHEYIDSEKFSIIASNSSVNAIATGTQFYIRGYPGSGNDGSIYISTYYNSLL